MAGDKRDKDLEPFLAQLPSSQLYPVGKTSWAGVSADVKSNIAKAVSPGGSPAEVLGDLQSSATLADNNEG